MSHRINYHFVRDKAYTKDDVLIYNLYAHNIPKTTTKSEISEYFQTFGDIVSVNFPNEASQQSSKIGIVVYSDSLSAAKVLKKSKHFINKNRIWVRACASKHQPDGKPLAATAETEIGTNAATILNLNDDCLDEIFKHLKMEDQINLALCCRRVQDVFVMRAKMKYKDLDLSELHCLTLRQMRQFLRMAGSQIEKLSGYAIHKDFVRLVEFLGIYCISVKSVRISCRGWRMKNMKNMWQLRNMSMIEELQIIYAKMQDDDVAVLKKLKKLKILSLEGNEYLTGRHIKYLTTVESLSLKKCHRIMPSYFIRICKNLKNLKCLDIQDCSLLETFASEDSVVKYLHKLETIKLSGDKGKVKSIASLPSLKHLYLRFDRLSSNFFAALANNRAEQLETLDIYAFHGINQETYSSIGKLKKLKCLRCPNNVLGDKSLQNISQLRELELLDIENCKGLSNMGLLDLIKKCPELITLNICGCKQLKQEFATMVLELLNSMKHQGVQKQPLKIFAYYSGINPLAVNTTEFKSATDLMTILFDYLLEYPTRMTLPGNATNF